MTSTERTGERRAELFVRESLPKPAARQCDTLEDRLENLEGTGAVSSTAVSTWDKRVECGDVAGAGDRDRFNEFAAWARERGVSLRPFFDTRRCYSMETGERGDWIVFPALCLAVYENGDLASVYPHADGEDYRSVSDGLDAIAATSTAAETAGTEETTRTDETPQTDESDRDGVVSGNAD